MAFKIRVLGVSAMETFYCHKLIQYNTTTTTTTTTIIIATVTVVNGLNPGGISYLFSVIVLT